MAKYVYPCVFTQEENGYYSVSFPDIESCYTSGNSLENAIDMAQDVLCLTLYGLEEEGKPIPSFSEIQSITVANGSFVSFITCDTIEYRKLFDNRSIKKTLTIPSWLNSMSEKKGLNFSAILQNALKQELHLSE